MIKLFTFIFSMSVFQLAPPAVAASDSFLFKAICYQGRYVANMPADIYDIAIAQPVAHRIKSNILPGDEDKQLNEWASMKNIMTGSWTEVRLVRVLQGDSRNNRVTQLDFAPIGNLATDEKSVLHCTSFGPDLFPTTYR